MKILIRTIEMIRMYGSNTDILKSTDRRGKDLANGIGGIPLAG